MPTASIARNASITRPGPIGSPAARKVRARNMTFSASRLASIGGGMGGGVGIMDAVAMGKMRGRRRSAWRGGQFRFRLLQQMSGLAAFDLGNVVLVFQQHAQGVVDALR